MKMKTMNTIIQLFILYLNDLYQNIKVNVFIFIVLTLPPLIMKIRIIYLIIIIILSVLVGIFNLPFFNDFFLFSDFSILKSNNNIDDEIINNSLGSNVNNGSSINSDPNLPNTPNPIDNESAVIINQNSNHDNISNDDSSLIEFMDEEEDDIRENNLEDSISDSDEEVRFNEIEYDPQFDDLEFNPSVFYHVDHPYFERMVHRQLENNNILELVELINSSNSPE